MGHGERNLAKGATRKTPLDREEAIAMSRETSCKSERRYGIRRVCQVLEFPRSTLYAQAKRQSSPVGPLQPLRRGPKAQDR